MAYLMPQRNASMEQSVRGLFGIQKPPTAIDSILSDPTILESSAGMLQAAEALRASDPAKAATLVVMAQQKRQEEQNVAAARSQSEAGLSTLTSYMESASSPESKQIIRGLMDSVAAGTLTTQIASSRALAAIKQYDKPVSTATVPTSVQEYEYAKSQGYTGTFEQWKRGGSADRTSNYSLMLEEAGIPQGTVQHQQRLNDYTQSMIRLNNNDMSPVEMVNLLNRDINGLATHDKTLTDLASLSRIQDSLPLLDQTNPQAFTALTASLSTLYNSNSRAQAEIDAFRNRKGLPERLGDWVVLTAGGTATTETKNNIKELISTLEASMGKQLVQEVTRVRSSYNGIIPEDVLNKWEANQLSTFEDDIESIVNRNLGDTP
jgi:hypothetical protein